MKKEIIIGFFLFIFFIGCSDNVKSPQQVYKEYNNNDCILLDSKDKQINIKNGFIEFNEIDICDKSKENKLKRVHFYFENNEWKIKKIEKIN